jgi:protein SCO1/2
MKRFLSIHLVHGSIAAVVLSAGAWGMRHPDNVSFFSEYLAAKARIHARATYRNIESIVQSPPPALLRSAIRMQQPQNVPDTPLVIGHIDQFRMSQLRNNYVLLYFGGLHCLRECPNMLSTFASVKRLLGDASHRVRFVMIGVDVEQDAPLTLLQVVRSYDPDFLAVTGSEETILTFATKHGVWVEKHPKGSAAGRSRYTSHSLYSLLISPEGKWIIAFPNRMAATEIADEIRLEMGPALP